jgi:hypothetical protein
MASKVASRVMFHTADVLHDKLPHGFDLALLFNVVHGYQHDDTVTLLRRAHDTLKPGGRLALFEQVQGSSALPLGRAALNLLSLSYFHVLGGQAHTFEDLRDWLGEAGFTDIERRNVTRAGSSVITAHRPG